MDIFSLCFPPSPTLTETTLPRQDGKVFIVTGGYSGIGLELTRILYRAGGKVYIAGRSADKARAAIDALGNDGGKLAFLHVCLDDLRTVAPAVAEFTRLENRLDVLFNNAGVAYTPPENVSAQGHELQMATNCYGPYLLTVLLLPILAATAGARVVFTSSLVTDTDACVLETCTTNLDAMLTPDTPASRYATTKVGNWFMAVEMAREFGKRGVLCVTQNPGNMRYPLLQDKPWLVKRALGLLLYESRYGAYTELYAGLSTDLTLDQGGAYVAPWGRIHTPRKELRDAVDAGLAAEFVAHCNEVTRQYR